jgi:localization factor PodJL
MQRQNPMTTGFNKFSQRLSGGGSTPAEAGAASAPKRGFASTLFAGVLGRKAKASGDAGAAGDDGDAIGHAAEPGSKKSKRKRLIFAGLVLLAAASAYGAQRQFASMPGLDLLGGAFAPETTPASAEPGNADPTTADPTNADTRERTGLSAHDGLTTASIAPVSSPAPRARGAASLSLPVAIGADSLRQAAVSGDANAQFVVAGRYLEGKAVPRDEEQAAQWYARAARQGLAAAQYRLGSMYEHGRGRPKDRSEAKVWYERAAERGNVNAMHNLAVLHTESRSGGPHYELAAKWFQKAAERGLKDSQYNLAVLNEKGLGMVRNPSDAVFWYSLAAVQGDREAGAKAKALEASLGQDAARQVHARLLAWRALPADRNANVVPLTDPSWQELS